MSWQAQSGDNLWVGRAVPCAPPSASSSSLRSYGPELEFVDAVFQSGPNGWDCTESWGHCAPAAKYAKMRDAHPGWNVFDLRQLLRETCTRYSSPGWDENNGYGFIQIANRAGMADGFQESPLVQQIQQIQQLDPGLPLQITAKIVSDTEVDFTWKNFEQTDFSATKISRVSDGHLIYSGNGTSCTWYPDASPRGTQVRFETVLSGGHPSGNGFTITLN